MKQYILMLFGLGCIYTACQKSNVIINNKPTSYKIPVVDSFTKNETVSIETCSQFTQENVNYSICFDSLITESRCPINAVCVWQGYAKGKFTFTEGTTAHTFYLNDAEGLNPTFFPTDTTINGIKITLVRLTPYPNLNVPTNYHSYKAQLIVNKL